MGEVYRARDTQLNRDVALKVLPELFAADPDRLARFKREAQVLASLNHPNIAAIYGLEEADGVRALVLELVEGPTLADRIAQGGGPEGPPLQQTGESVDRDRRGGPSGPGSPTRTPARWGGGARRAPFACGSNTTVDRRVRRLGVTGVAAGCERAAAAPKSKCGCRSRSSGVPCGCA
jgi:hypothetical protein